MTVQVGGAVAWGEVEDGMMVRDAVGWHAVRLRGRGIFVGEPGEPWLSANPWSDEGRWRWTSVEKDPVTVVALGITGEESADDLRRLAEVFEVREAWGKLMDEAMAHKGPPEEWAAKDAALKANPAVVAYFSDESRDARRFFERLHAAGWRPGMTAEEAVARLSGRRTA